MSDLDLLIGMFESSEQACVASREEAEQARDYYDGKQLSEAQRQELKKKRQPQVWDNLIMPKVDSLRGLERQSRTDPKAFARSVSRDADAFAATDALRYVKDATNFDVKRSQVFENMMIEGYGGVEVGHRTVRGALDPDITYISWDRLFYDPHSSLPDFSDAAYLGFITWMDQGKALSYCKAGAKWAGKEAVVRDTMARGCSSQYLTYDDKPRWSYWADSTRKRIRVTTIYFEKDGVWQRAVFTLAGELEPAAPSPYLCFEEDEKGRPECALIFQSAYVDRDNDRYGLARNMIPLQDEVNVRRRRFVHFTNTRAVRVGTSTTQDAETIRQEAARPDGVIIADRDEFEFIPNNDLATAQFTLLTDTTNRLKSIGPNAYLQGKAGTDQSGKAILAQQQAGMTEMAPLLDGLGHFNLRVYRALWSRIRQLWAAERWVRITDDQRNVRFVGFNVTKGALALQKIKAAVDAGKLDQQTAIGYVHQVRADPTMMQPANIVGEMDVDIHVEDVPHSPTLEIEQFQQLTQLAGTGVFGQPLPPDMAAMIIQASNLRDKDKILAMIEEAKNAPAAPPSPEQQLALRNAAATASEREAKAKLYGARAESVVAEPFMAGHAIGAAQ